MITECSEKACNYLTAFLKQMLLRRLLLVGFFFLSSLLLVSFKAITCKTFFNLHFYEGQRSHRIIHDLFDLLL